MADKTTAPLAAALEIAPRRNHVDMLELKEETKKPGIRYRWSLNNPNNIARHKFQGYWIVQESEGVRPVIDDYDSKGKGVIIIGDVILMATSEANYQEGRKQVRQRSEDRIKAVDENFEEKVAEAGTELIRERP